MLFVGVEIETTRNGRHERTDGGITMIPIEPSLRFASCPAFDIVASFLARSKPSLGKRKGEKPLSKSRSKLVYLGNLYLECLGERIGYTGGSDVSGKSYRYLSYNAEDIRVSITRKIRFDGLLFKIFIFFFTHISSATEKQEIERVESKSR